MMHRVPAGRIALWQLLLTATLASVAAAQEKRDADDAGRRRHEARCRRAAKVIETGIPRSQQQWANGIIFSCNDQVPTALAAAVRRLSTSRDTTALRLLLGGASHVRDAGFFNAALEVAGQSSATAEARAVGFLVAATELTDHTHFRLSVLMAATGPSVCEQQGRHDHSLRSDAGTSLPADAAARPARGNRDGARHTGHALAGGECGAMRSHDRQAVEVAPARESNGSGD